jgi:CheY-like chemotaxis protein
MPKTLLLADDSVTIQKVVGISFANEDIVLLTVDNGDDAIARAREARPDVILADVVMPGKNGYDVCQAIKADASLAHIPVLLLTGTFEAFDEQRAARVGADGHITKPFEAQSLVDTVNGLLARPPAGAGDAGGRADAARSGGAPIGTLRPARVAAPAPPPQPVSHTADTAYDFFDEEVTAPRSGAEARSAGEAPREDTTVLISQPTPPPAAPGPDSFGFDDPAPERETALPPRAPDRGPLMAEPGFGADELEVGGAGAEESSLFDAFEPATPASAPSEEAPAAAAFEWSPPAEPSVSAPLAWDVRSEAAPSGDIGWEVQGDTDPEPLGWEPESAPAAAAPAPAVAEEADWFTPSPDAQAGARLMEPVLESGDPLGAAAPAAEERGFGEFALEADLEGGGYGEAVLDPRGAHDYDVSSSDLGAPLAAPGPLSSAPPAPAPAALAAVPAAERKELHDALEKLAWEAFGPVAESLVREAVERIERIAWEVIPQMAEAVIREEIRKLKGD